MKEITSSQWCHPDTEIFSKRRKIYSICVESLSMISVSKWGDLLTEIQSLLCSNKILKIFWIASCKYEELNESSSIRMTWVCVEPPSDDRLSRPTQTVTTSIAGKYNSRPSSCCWEALQTFNQWWDIVSEVPIGRTDCVAAPDWLVVPGRQSQRCRCNCWDWT